LKIKNEENLYEVKKEALAKFCIAYPNLYKIAMSNLGYISVCYLLNTHPLALCERVVLPNKKDATLLKKRRAPLVSIESGKPVMKFDVLAFSLSFENDYINIPKILDLSNIPAFARDRDESHPLVIAGGIAAIMNPEPIADFFDAFLLGDSPKMINEFVDKYTKLKGGMPKLELLRELSKIKGVYVPSLYKVEYNDDGSLKSFSAEKGIKPRVKVEMTNDLESFPAYSYIISKAAHFSDMFLLEISRGCMRFCRFCAAGYNYMPYKRLSVEKIKKIIKRSGGKKIGLVGAAVSDYDKIDKLCGLLLEEGKKFSVSSFRADSLSDNLLAGLKNSGHKTLTIAPEAGSQRLRDIIRKGISEEDILSASYKIAAFGILNIKLYYIIGLPFETGRDIDELISLTKKIRDIFLAASKKLKRAGNVTVSISPFVPKPGTPFFFKGMADTKELKKKLRVISGSLKKEPNIELEKVSVKDAALETLLSRGDRRLSGMIRLMADGKSLNQSAKEHNIDTGFYVHRDISFGEVLPFDFRISGIKKDFLIKEYKKARNLYNKE
jgi:radical SAM superfamily enzyme YgiQ (UPF0313 family)